MDGEGSHYSSGADAMYRRAKAIIPGGTQLLSKRPEMWAPNQWPAYYHEARGCEIIDIDGRRWLDMSAMGIGSCLLGYGDPDVTEAVVRRVRAGSMSTLNSPDEVELAELLVEIHPWAGGVRYARTGGEAMSVAVRIARAWTGRDGVAICGYHGWHDWYLAANLTDQDQGDALEGHLLPGLSPVGVPRGLTGTTHVFDYNHLDQLEAIVKKQGNRLAAVVMEPTRHRDPAPGFLEGVRELCDRQGVVLVFDEITSGWRIHLGGAHLKYGVTPDIAVFAKAIGNGHPMAAIIGVADVMAAAQETFISSTYWTEGVGPTAALATIHKMRRMDLPGHLKRIGTFLRDGLREVADHAGVRLKLAGHPAITTISFEHPANLALQTLLTARLLERGILSGGVFYGSLAHEREHVERYLEAVRPVFVELAQAIENGDIEERICGPVRHMGFARIT